MNMSHQQPKKQKFSPNREQLKKMLKIARGDEPSDLLIKNVTLLDLIHGGTELTHLAISDEWIAGVGLDYDQGRNVIDATGLTVVPGFIDGHLHIESSLMHPFEFERLTLPLGTTTAICDPHEITNVLGERGFSWFLRAAEMMEQNLFVQVSSCIPSMPGFETQNGIFDLEKMKIFRSHPQVLGLAEMMNYPGVIGGDDEILDKLFAFEELHLDGHCPLLRGKKLNAYIAAGIQNCHETVTSEEGREKLSKGMGLILREGSVAKNLKNLATIVTEFNAHQCFLCTDDRNPQEIDEEGHLNYLVWKLINVSRLPVHVAYRLSSYSAAKHFGLKRLGLIAPGHRADFILLEDPLKVMIKDVYIAGKRVQELDLDHRVKEKFNQSAPPLENTVIRRPLQKDEIKFPQAVGRYQVIEVIPHEIITKKKVTYFDGKNYDLQDICKICVVERYGHQLPPSQCFVTGFGMKEGAIACSVAHDAHNVIVLGKSESDMITAVNALIQSGGGLCAVKNNTVLGLLPLEIAGLMSIKSAEEITVILKDLHLKIKNELGCELDGPFLQLAFIALPVIPSLKLTDKGLVDAEKMEFVDFYLGK